METETVNRADEGSQEAELRIAEQAARAGGEVVSRCFREGVAVRSKASSNLVSDADIESEEAIIGVIRRAFPRHSVLAEESRRDDTAAEHLWVIDPLDGTNNFAHGIPHFAVSVAYYHNSRPECGVVWDPVDGDLYTVQRGGGAFKNGHPIQVSNAQQLNEVLVAVGFYYDRGAMMEATLAAIQDLFRQQIHGIRRFGTASLDLCQVAAGNFGAFFEYELSPWDFAAGSLVVQEAGGSVTTCRGEELPLASTGIVATNKSLHEAVLDIVGRYLPDDSAF